jgi:hypothetical protein
MQVVKSGMLIEQEEEILNCKKRSVLGFLGIGKALSIINKNDLWRFSDSCTSFSSYVENVQKIKKSWAYSLVTVYERFSPILLAHEDLKTVEVTRLVRLLPFVQEDNIEELAHSAALLPAKAFDDQVRQLSGKTPQDTCEEHDWVIIKRCKICGLKVRAEGDV